MDREWSTQVGTVLNIIGWIAAIPPMLLIFGLGASGSFAIYDRQFGALLVLGVMGALVIVFLLPALLCWALAAILALLREIRDRQSVAAGLVSASRIVPGATDHAAADPEYQRFPAPKGWKDPVERASGLEQRPAVASAPRDSGPPSSGSTLPPLSEAAIAAIRAGTYVRSNEARFRASYKYKDATIEHWNDNTYSVAGQSKVFIDSASAQAYVDSL